MYACVWGDNPRAFASGLIIALTCAKEYNTSFVYYEIFIAYKNGSRVILCPNKNVFFSLKIVLVNSVDPVCLCGISSGSSLFADVRA